MKLIIDIPEDVYTRLFDNSIHDNEIAVDDVLEMARALRLGIPLDSNLSKMSPMVIATAYLYAMNLELYGVDVTKAWVTATQNASALSRAHEKGYYEGLKKRAESEE